MKRFLQLVLLLPGILCGCSKSGVLEPGPFSSDFATALRKADSGLKVQIVHDLELKITTAQGKEFTFFLDNAYGLYKQNPNSRESVIQKYVTSGLETIAHPESESVDRTRIVPVIKDRPWLEEVRNGISGRSGDTMPGNVFEDFSQDLVIVYAEDSPKNIRYLRPDDLESLRIGREELRGLACENLKRLLPPVQQEAGDGFYQMGAGGDYDASLLLFDSIWDPMKKNVHGDLVVAVPGRDYLLVTGSADQKGLANVEQIVAKVYAEDPYRLTTNLFVLRNGRFVEFKP